MVVNAGCISQNHESRIVKIVEETISIPVFAVSDLQISYCNRSFQELFKLGELSHAIPLQDLFVQFDNVAHLLEQCETMPVKNVMVQCKNSESRKFWALLCLSKAADAHGVYYAGTIQDQTEIIEREKLLRQRNEDLKKLNSQLDRFIYSASHDIRQPIASIMGLIHLMQMQDGNGHSADYLSKIETSVVKLDQFLAKIMQFSKNSHEHIGSHEVDFHNLISEKISKSASEVAEKGISVSVEIADSFALYSDAERIAVAIHHVFKNCLDFYDPSQAAPYIKILVTTYPRKAIIEIIDNGIGISKAHLDKVTGMFYRATDRSKGSGLGLYIVNEIVLKLKGQLLIDSELGLGTMVRIEIPNGVKGELVNRKRLLTKNG